METVAPGSPSIEIRKYGRQWTFPVAWDGPAYYWFESKDGWGELELPYCQDLVEVRAAVGKYITEETKDLDWRDWSVQRLGMGDLRPEGSPNKVPD